MRTSSFLCKCFIFLLLLLLFFISLTDQQFSFRFLSVVCVSYRTKMMQICFVCEAIRQRCGTYLRDFSIITQPSLCCCVRPSVGLSFLWLSLQRSPVASCTTRATSSNISRVSVRLLKTSSLLFGFLLSTILFFVSNNDVKLYFTYGIVRFGFLML